MAELKSLDDLFERKIFRIPDYQRGYAWQISHLKAFWEDLINLSGDRSHYTGVLTLKEVDSKEINKEDNEYWLIEDRSYKMYHIVDGQQRLTTFVVFIQAFIDFVKNKNASKSNQDIYITDSLSLDVIISQYLYKTKPTGGQFRTYKFGYTVDNPSYDYLRYEIFNEGGSGSITKTLYTLNLENAKSFFYKQLEEIYLKEGLDGLREVYKNLTKRFLFNEYVIKDELNVFVAFETMNNRGKHLSNLELLKNRLIYLTTLYTDEELDPAGRKSLRDDINGAWKEVYHQLGRNIKHPLNDDEFLRAHWTMYFQYSRKRGDDYIKFLLDEQFSPKKIYKKNAHEVDSLEEPKEPLIDSEVDDADIDNDTPDDAVITENDFIDIVDNSTKTGTAGKQYMKAIQELESFIGEPIFNSYSLDKLKILKKRLSNNGDLHDFSVRTDAGAPSAAIGKLIAFRNGELEISDVQTVIYLQPLEIKEYIDSLAKSVGHWFDSYYPDDSDLSDEEKDALNRLNRIGMVYFRPLVMSVLKNGKSPEKRIKLFNQIERFIFIVFRLSQSRSNYKSSKFYIAAREFNWGKQTLEDIEKELNQDEFNAKYFRDYLHKRFDGGNGYYGWHGLRYFLYEYELHLLSQSRQEKMPSWEDLLRTRKDKISIEHIFPQTPTDSWKESFADIDEADYPFYSDSIGNLLLLSGSINSALQNDDFADKKNPRTNDADKKIRNGYSDGSHSEIEVSRCDEWTPAQIEKRGLRLLDFMEERWNIKFESAEAKKSLLFPGKKDEVVSEQSD